MLLMTNLFNGYSVPSTVCLLKNGLVAIVANRYHKEHTLQAVHSTLRKVHPRRSTPT